MTIPVSASSTTVIGNGSQSSFQFNFIGVAASDISVIYTDLNGNETPLTQSQYTLTLNAPLTGALWGVGGTVVYPISGSPIAAGTTLTITRTLPLTQLTTISNQGAFTPQVIEQALDILCLEIQQVSGRTGQIRGIWITGVMYNYGDIVQDGANGLNTQNYYICVNANTSGTWATDLAAGDWSLGLNVQNISQYTGGAVTANTVYAGPASGSPANPSFRSLTSADIPVISHVANSVPANATASTAPLSDLTLGTNTLLGRGSGNISTISPDGTSVAISGTTLGIVTNASLSGSPTTTTQSGTDSSTKIATTAQVAAAMAANLAIPKAMANFGYISSAVSIFNNLGISSITRTGTGVYSIAFSVAAPNANYAVAIGGGLSTGGYLGNIMSPSTSGFTLNIFVLSGTNTDPTNLSFFVYHA